MDPTAFCIFMLAVCGMLLFLFLFFLRFSRNVLRKIDYLESQLEQRKYQRGD
jgi:hypothetical protein